MKTRFAAAAGVMAIGLVLTACSSGYAPSSGPAAPAPTETPAPGGQKPIPVTGSATVDVVISGFAFSPAAVTVQAGTTVRWTNKDSAGHTVVSDTGVWESGDLGQGGTFSREFDTPGTFAYHCGVHPSMKGEIIVTP
jgi:plastocyanin